MPWHTHFVDVSCLTSFAKKSVICLLFLLIYSSVFTPDYARILNIENFSVLFAVCKDSFIFTRMTSFTYSVFCLVIIHYLYILQCFLFRLCKSQYLQLQSGVISSFFFVFAGSCRVY